MKLAYTLATLMAADIGTTWYGLTQGLVEQNPLYYAAGGPAFFAAKVAVMIGVGQTGRIFRGTPTLARIMYCGVFGMLCIIQGVIVVWNLHVIV